MDTSRVFVLALIGALGAATITAQEPARATILVSRQLAEAEQLTVGSVVRLSPDADGTDAREFRVAGIYEPTPDPARLGSVPREVRLHLPDLLELTRAPGVPAGTEHVEAVNVALTDTADARSFARDVNARLPGVLARPTSEAAGARRRSACLNDFTWPSR